MYEKELAGLCLSSKSAHCQGRDPIKYGYTFLGKFSETVRFRITANLRSVDLTVGHICYCKREKCRVVVQSPLEGFLWLLCNREGHDLVDVCRGRSRAPRGRSFLPDLQTFCHRRRPKPKPQFRSSSLSRDADYMD
ncbi:hypothetical protein AAC387_Pa12g2079 [Persea americana]